MTSQRALSLDLPLLELPLSLWAPGTFLWGGEGGCQCPETAEYLQTAYSGGRGAADAVRARVGMSLEDCSSCVSRPDLAACLLGVQYKQTSRGQGSGQRATPGRAGQHGGQQRAAVQPCGTRPPDESRPPEVEHAACPVSCSCPGLASLECASTRAI